MAKNKKEDFLASETNKDLENMSVEEETFAETEIDNSEEKDKSSKEKKPSKIKEIFFLSRASELGICLFHRNCQKSQEEKFADIAASEGIVLPDVNIDDIKSPEE